MNVKYAQDIEGYMSGTAIIRPSGGPSWTQDGDIAMGTPGNSVETRAHFESITLSEALTIGGPFPNKVMRCFLPSNVVIDRDYEVISVGLHQGTYVVIAGPETWEDPYNGTASHIEVIVREVQV